MRGLMPEHEVPDPHTNNTIQLDPPWFFEPNIHLHWHRLLWKTAWGRS